MSSLFRARVLVRLQPAIYDPQGEAIRRSLASAGVEGVESVRQGKLIELEVRAASAGEAEARVREIAARVLANPVLEDHVVEIGPGPDEPDSDEPDPV